MTNMKSYTASKGLGRAQAQVPWLWHRGLLFSLHQWFSRLIFSRILFPNETLSKPWFTEQIKLETFCLNRGKGGSGRGLQSQSPFPPPWPSLRALQPLWGSLGSLRTAYGNCSTPTSSFTRTSHTPNDAIWRCMCKEDKYKHAYNDITENMENRVRSYSYANYPNLTIADSLIYFVFIFFF